MSTEKWGVKASGDYIEVALATHCLICGESVPASSINYVPKVCDKCKAAVMKIRKESED